MIGTHLARRVLLPIEVSSNLYQLLPAAEARARPAINLVEHSRNIGKAAAHSRNEPLRTVPPVILITEGKTVLSDKVGFYNTVVT